MTPYYQDEWATLYLGDCRDIVPSLPPVDLVLTDPVWPNCPEGLLVGQHDPFGLLCSTLDLIETPRIVIVMRHDSDPRFLAAVPVRWPFFRLQMLPYAVPSFIGRTLGGLEIAYCFGEPLPSKPCRRLYPGIGPKAQPGSRQGLNGHPCPRAMTHFSWLVQWWAEPGALILDPYAGSATTGVAATTLGRQSILIEINEALCENAADRLRHTTPSLFAAPPPPKPEQLTLLKGP